MFKHKALLISLGLLAIVVAIGFCFMRGPRWTSGDVAALEKFFSNCDPIELTTSKTFWDGRLKVLVAPPQVDKDGEYCVKVAYKDLIGQLDFVWLESEARCTRKKISIHTEDRRLSEVTHLLE